MSLAEVRNPQKRPKHVLTTRARTVKASDIQSCGQNRNKNIIVGATAGSSLPVEQRILSLTKQNPQLSNEAICDQLYNGQKLKTVAVHQQRGGFLSEQQISPQYLSFKRLVYKVLSEVDK